MSNAEQSRKAAVSEPQQQQDRVVIFDTTLRDGEQSPGASMNLEQKLQVASALRELGVDVIEAGFAAASPGDLESIQAVGRQIEGPIIASLSRSNKGDIAASWEALQGRPPQALPRLPRHLPRPPRLQAEDGEGGDHPPLRRGREDGAGEVRGRRVLRRGLRPHRARVPRRGDRAGDRRGRRHREHPGHRRLRAPAPRTRRRSPTSRSTSAGSTRRSSRSTATTTSASPSRTASPA